MPFITDIQYSSGHVINTGQVTHKIDVTTTLTHPPTHTPTPITMETTAGALFCSLADSKILHRLSAPWSPVFTTLAPLGFVSI
jgi:hypothetical protein